ncbi:MAG TPA: hypothetical protein VFF33_05275 [Ignavibacteriaceae bacterium]|nr:hypothetical protein [Ignavibacteriaceae bacterium]
MENENLDNKYSDIKGWGIDADPDNEPTYPIKDYTGDDHNRLNYERPSQQPVDVEILHSNERPNISAVFGTSIPPTGISGAIRRYAFKHSESSYKHWLSLLLADRINVVEGYFDDIKHGYIPNVFKEHGFKSEWKHNRGAIVTKMAVGTLVASSIIFMAVRKKK